MKKQFTLNNLAAGEDTLPLTPNPYTKNYPDNTRQPIFKKPDPVPSADCTLIKPVMERRAGVRRGVTMVQEYLKRSSSKLTVYICCFLMRKVKSKIQELDKEIKATLIDKENYISSFDIKKALNLVSEEKEKIFPKLVPFEDELKSIKLPQDIVYMRYAEEEGLTQEKDGLVQLLEIDDYLQDTLSVGYLKMTRKELLDEYERRIVRKE
jgi:hypothetical protein